VLIKTADELMNYNKSEEQSMENLIRQISEAGVKVVVAGSAIGEMALHFLERYKLMSVKVPSKFDLRRVAKAVGATPMARLGTPTAEEVGFCDLVSVEEIGSTKVTIFRKDSDAGISTIVVRASTQNTLDDIERSVDDGVNVYKATAKDGRFIPGAGAAEIELSRQLQAFADSTPGIIQYAIKKFGEAFEVVPRTLAENAGLRATDVISNLYASHQKGNTADGIDIEGSETSLLNTKQAEVFDLLASKASAIKLATDAAITILRVDQIIMAKPAGGPKPPQQGGMDTDD